MSSGCYGVFSPAGVQDTSLDQVSMEAEKDNFRAGDPQ